MKYDTQLEQTIHENVGDILHLIINGMGDVICRIKDIDDGVEQNNVEKKSSISTVIVEHPCQLIPQDNGNLGIAPIFPFADYENDSFPISMSQIITAYEPQDQIKNSFTEKISNIKIASLSDVQQGSRGH